MKFLALLAASLALASAQDCYTAGQRNRGAFQKPPVPYKPCCDGQPSVPREGPENYGLFCPERIDTCYFPGERSTGAAGQPLVAFKECCTGEASVPKDGDWGMFCPEAEKCAVTGERSIGEDGHTFVAYKPCCDANEVATKMVGTWGWFCLLPLAPGASAPAVVTPPPSRPVPIAGPVSAERSNVGDEGSTTPRITVERKKDLLLDVAKAKVNDPEGFKTDLAKAIEETESVSVASAQFGMSAEGIEAFRRTNALINLEKGIDISEAEVLQKEAAEVVAEGRAEIEALKAGDEAPLKENKVSEESSLTVPTV